MNRNAYIGRNVEVLFKNSIGDNPSVISKIQRYFKINSRFLNAVSTGIHAEKADVKDGIPVNVEELSSMWVAPAERRA